MIGVTDQRTTSAGGLYCPRPAADVETLVTEGLGKLSPDRAASQTDIRNLIDRAVIGRTTIRIQLSEVAEENDSARILTFPGRGRHPIASARSFTAQTM